MEDMIFDVASDPRWHSLSILTSTFVACGVITAIQPASWSVDTRSRVTSTIHAIVATVLSAIILVELLQDDRRGEGFASLLFPVNSNNKFSTDTVWFHGTTTAHFAVCVTTGYIMFDSVLGIAFPGLLDTPMAIHHAIVIIAYVGGIIANFGVNYLAVLLMNEASTPFVNVFFITKDSWKDWRKAANGALMWLSYLFCRLLFNTVFAISMYQTVTSNAINAHPILIMVFMIIFSLAQVLNANWFFRITRGLLKEVKKMIFGSDRHKDALQSQKMEPAVLSSPSQDPPLSQQQMRQRKH